MANVTLKCNLFTPSASSPRSGAARLPTSVSLAATSADISLADFEGKVKILNIVPAFDPGVGAASARRFEKEAGDRGNVVMLRQLGLLQDTGDEDLQMLEWGSILDCRGLEIGRVQAVFELDRPW